VASSLHHLLPPKHPILGHRKIHVKMTSKLQPTNPLSGPGDIEALPFRSIISDEFQHDTPGFVRAFAGKVWMVQGIPTKVV